jgi:hypothetical protein
VEVMIAFLLLAYRILTFTLSDSLADPATCKVLAVPPRDSLAYVSVECSHDSLAWAEVARWGARHWTGGSYRIAAWPDTLGPRLWYRVSPVRAVQDTGGAWGNVWACPSKPVRVK